MVLTGQVECMNLSRLCVQFSTFPSAFHLFVLSPSLFFIQRLRPIFHLTSFSISSSCTGAILCSCVCGCTHATDVFKMTVRLGCSVAALVGRQMVTCAWTFPLICSAGVHFGRIFNGQHPPRTLLCITQVLPEEGEKDQLIVTGNLFHTQALVFPLHSP